MNRLKLELLEKIINCDDLSTLKRVEKVLVNFSEVNEVNEEKEEYLKEVDPVPKSHYQKLEEEHENFKSGGIKGMSWKEFRKEIKSNHGF